MRFSIVIPAYNRSEKLRACADSLIAQEFDKKEYEIIVVDDGSTDNTRKMIKRMQKKSPVALAYFYQDNSGQATARNRGIEEARGDIIIFIGDDIVPAQNFLAMHDRAHKWYPEINDAVLGFVTWHPKLAVTSLMSFLERGGAIFGAFGGSQFAYDLLEGKREADYRFFYTANISLKRGLLEENKFDPWFSGYGWEDIELGYRLAKKAGLRIWYAPEAVAYHDHPMDAASWAERMRSLGRAARKVDKKYPELGVLPSQNKVRIFKILSNPVMLALMRRFSHDMHFYALSKKYFLEGMKE